MKRLIILFLGLLLLIQPVSATWFNSSWSTKRNLHINWGVVSYSAELDNPTEDGYILLNNRYNEDTHIYMGCGDITSNKIYHGYVEWNISSIPDNAIITNAKFKYHGKDNFNDAHITQIVCKPSVSSNQTIYDDVGNGTVYIDQDNFPVANNNQEINLGINAVSDLQNALPNNWFAIGLQGDIEDTSGNTATIYSENYTSANPKPTLYVEYTTSESKTLNYYQMNLNLSYSDIPETQLNFDDIRFVNVSDGASLPYWVEDQVNSSWCNVWVNVTTLHIGWNNDTVALYYGNSEATSVSDIDTTMINGWDFESDTVGNVPSGWTEDNAHGSLRVVDGKTTRLQHDSSESSLSNNYASITSITDNNNRMIQFTINSNISNTYDYIIIHDSSEHINEGIFLAFKSDGNIYYDDGSWHILQAYDAFTDYKIEIYNIDLTNNQYDIDINGVNQGTNLGFNAPQTTLDYFTYEGSGGESTDENIDNFFICKYSTSPPTYILGDAGSYIPSIIPPTKPSFTEIDLIDQLHHEYTHIEPETMHTPIYTGLNYISIPLYQYNITLNALFEDHPVNNDTIKKYINGTWNVSIYNNSTWNNASNIEPIEPCIGYEYNRTGDNFTLNVSGYMKYNITIFNYENRIGTNIIRPMRSDKDD